MSELFFVLKCLVFTAVLVVFMQIKVGGQSMESHAYHWLQKSNVSMYVQSVAAGGAMAIRNLGSSAKSAASTTAHSFNEGAAEQAHR
jgi:hypothetical protein